MMDPTELLDVVDTPTKKLRVTDSRIIIEEITTTKPETSDKRKNLTKKWLRGFVRVPYIVFLTALTIYVCMLSAERYFNTWVQTSIESTDMHVSQIPFPAVTICPISTANLTHAQFYNTDTQTVQTTSRAQKFERLLYIMDVIRAMRPTAVEFNDAELRQFDDFNDWLLKDLFHFWNYECKDLFTNCIWRGEAVPCCNIFHPIATVEGLCFAFNSNKVFAPDPKWPLSVIGAGRRTGLQVVIDQSIQSKRVDKVAIVLHSFNEYLGPDIVYASHESLSIPVEPFSFTADTELLTLPLELRHCHFQKEEHTNESQSNCIMACHLAFIEKKCRCRYNYAIPVPMSTYNNLNYEIHNFNMSGHRRSDCTVADLPCVYKHRRIFFSMSNIIDDSANASEFSTYNCKCYPDCNRVQYQIAPFTDVVLTLKRPKKDIEVDIYFQQDQIFAFRSMKRFTMLDLMVSFGGVAGLFLGFSMIGIFDFILASINRCLGCCRKSLCSSEKKSDKRGA